MVQIRSPSTRTNDLSLRFGRFPLGSGSMVCRRADAIRNRLHRVRIWDRCGQRRRSDLATSSTKSGSAPRRARIVGDCEKRAGTPRGRPRKKETHGELPVGFRGEKQPSRDGAADSERIEPCLSGLCGETAAPARVIYFPSRKRLVQQRSSKQDLSFIPCSVSLWHPSLQFLGLSIHARNIRVWITFATRIEN
jgi:hypothetical protein